MYCISCGAKVIEGAKFCPICGCNLSDVFVSNEESDKETTSINEVKSKKKTKVKKPMTPRKKKIIAKLVLYAVVVIGIFVLYKVIAKSINDFFSDVSVSSESTNRNIDRDKGDSDSDSIKIPSNIKSFLKNDELSLDFIYACEQIGIKPDKISSLEKENGTDYWPVIFTFWYDSLRCRAYCYGNNTVHKINCADGSYGEIYVQGYESYPYTDFVFDDMGTYLLTQSKNTVKEYLNYPKTAKFPWSLDAWQLYRNRDLYTVSGYVTAKNAFGVESDIDFMFIYHCEGETYYTVYFVLDGETLIDTLDSLPDYERKKVQYNGPVDITEYKGTDASGFTEIEDDSEQDASTLYQLLFPD